MSHSHLPPPTVPPLYFTGYGCGVGKGVPFTLPSTMSHIHTCPLQPPPGPASQATAAALAKEFNMAIEKLGLPQRVPTTEYLEPTLFVQVTGKAGRDAVHRPSPILPAQHVSPPLLADPAIPFP
eukprot:scaffold14755_cov91-Isochrysis_galbana.AAC.2